MIITNDRLTDVEFIQAGTLQVPIKPELIVVHYTATRAGTLRSVAKGFAVKGADRSANLVISEEGRMIQCAGFTTRTAHAGISVWNGREGCNGFSIGIELVNPGPLVDGLDTLPGKREPWAYGVFEGRHKNGGPYKTWARYPDGQFAVLVEVCRALALRYGIREIVGHDDIAPTRKIDPGPAMPLDILRGYVFA